MTDEPTTTAAPEPAAPAAPPAAAPAIGGPSNGAPSNGAPTALPEADGEFFGQLERLLDKLVPPDNVTVTTATGDQIVLPGAIPARAQVRVFRHIRELLELDEIAAALLAMQKGGTVGVIDVVVALATDEHVANKLALIFTDAYPNVLEGRDPLDELPLEELVVALVPFSQRFLKRVGTGITTIAKGASDLR